MIRPGSSDFTPADSTDSADSDVYTKFFYGLAEGTLDEAEVRTFINRLQTREGRDLARRALWLDAALSETLRGGVIADRDIEQPFESIVSTPSGRLSVVKKRHGVHAARWLIGLPAAAALMMVLLLGVYRNAFVPSKIPVVAHIEGLSTSAPGVRAHVIREGIRLKLLQGMDLKAGDTLHSGSSAIDVSFADASRIHLARNTTVQLEAASSSLMKPSDAPHLVLRHGELLAQIAPRPADAPARLATDAIDVTVHGTRFWLRAGDDRVGDRITMLDGRVSLRDRARPAAAPVALSAGKSAEMTAGGLEVRGFAPELRHISGILEEHSAAAGRLRLRDDAGNVHDIILPHAQGQKYSDAHALSDPFTDRSADVTVKPEPGQRVEVEVETSGFETALLRRMTVQRLEQQVLPEQQGHQEEHR